MILVTGGSGMVGSELKKFMPECLYPSSKELNLLSDQSIRDYFKINKIKSVIHLAAYVGSLHDNIENRVKYFDLNIIMNTNITKISYEFGITKFIGILSTCIYPDKNMTYPMLESSIHEGAPHKDLYSYAYAKRAHAVQLDAYKNQYGVDFSYLIPTNLYGYSSHFERLHFVNDLVLKIF
jgi:GDP-L-fucose synthase